MKKEKLEEILLALYQEYYRFEFDRKDKLSQYSSLPLTLLMALYAFIGFLLSSLPSTNADEVLYRGFWCLFGLFLLNTIGASIGWILAIFGVRQSYLPTPKEIDDYYIELKAHNKKHKIAGTEKALIAWLRQEYGLRTAKNIKSNDRKASQILWTMRLASFASIFAILTAVPYFAMKANKPPEVYNVKITNLGAAGMSNDTKRVARQKSHSLLTNNRRSKQPQSRQRAEIE